MDASGTWTSPNPLGADGYPALGEREHADRITYGIPDLADPAVAARYAGKHVAVAGKGASAQGVLVGLAALAAARPGHPGLLAAAPAQRRRRVRRRRQRPARAARQARTGRPRRPPASGVVTHVTRFRTECGRARRPTGASRSTSVDGQQVVDVDEVVVVTGFRPDFASSPRCASTSTPRSGSTRVLADQIHPDHHCCGDVAPHGHRELAQPEPGLYLVGMKSYGRAPSFLAMTGFEQVRSVVAALDGDLEAADRVELVLPETGVCNGAGAFDDPDAVAAGAGRRLLRRPGRSGAAARHPRPPRPVTR